MEKEKIDGELLAVNANTMRSFVEAFRLFTDDNFGSLKNFSLDDLNHLAAMVEGLVALAEKHSEMADIFKAGVVDE